MRVPSAFKLVAAGLLGRVFFLMFDSIQLYSFGRSVSFLLVGFNNMNDHIKECAFLASKKKLDVNNACERNNIIFDSLYSIVSYVDAKDQDLVLKLIALVVQLATLAILNRMWDRGSTKFAHSFYLYWMNPVFLLSCGLSASVCIHQFVLVLCCYLAYQGWSVGFVLAMTLLCSSDSVYFITIPAFLALLCNPNSNISNYRKLGSVDLAIRSLVVVLIVMSVTNLYGINGTDIEHSLNFIDIASFIEKLPSLVLEAVKSAVLFKRESHYTPAAGVLWYLKAQMFIEYGTYFNGLLLLTRVLVAFLFSPFVGNVGALDGVLLTLSSVLYLQDDASWANMCFVMMVALLAQHRIVAKMKFLPLITMGILVSCAVSTVTFHQWVVIGNGNGNFLFFPGFACWVFATLAIIEYSKGATAIHNPALQQYGLDASTSKVNSNGFQSTKQSGVYDKPSVASTFE